jgi:hypothetical protein
MGEKDPGRCTGAEVGGATAGGLAGAGVGFMIGDGLGAVIGGAIGALGGILGAWGTADSCSHVPDPPDPTAPGDGDYDWVGIGHSGGRSPGTAILTWLLLYGGMFLTVFEFHKNNVGKFFGPTIWIIGLMFQIANGARGMLSRGMFSNIRITFRSRKPHST